MENPPPTPTPPPPLLHPSGHSQNEVTMAMWSHLIPAIALLLGLGILGFLGPLLIWQQNQGRSAFVEKHSKDSLNFQLSLLLYGAIIVVAAIVGLVVTFGLALFIIIPVAIVVLVGALVLSIIATVKAANGEDFEYILTINFVK